MVVMFSNVTSHASLVGRSDHCGVGSECFADVPDASMRREGSHVLLHFFAVMQILRRIH